MVQLTVAKKFLSAQGNGVCSPYSLKQCLALAYTLGNEKTRQSIASIGFDFENVAKVPGIKGVNAVFSHKDGARLENAQALLEPLQARVHVGDFKNNLSEVVSRINALVASTTEGMIQEFINSNNLNGLLVALVNAVLLQAAWRTPFTNTVQMPFGSSGKKVEMMQCIAQIAYYNHPKATILIKPMEDNLNAVFLVPDEANMNLSDIIEHLDTIFTEIPEWEHKQVALGLPKLSGIEQSYQLDQLFPEVFGTSFHLPEILPHTMVSVGGKQKVRIEWDEKMVSAAAATTVVARGMMEKFIIDKEFIALISYKNEVLFAASIIDP